MPDEVENPADPSNQTTSLDDFQSLVDDDGLSLDDLSQAYAELLNQGENPYGDTRAETGELSSEQSDEEPTEAEDTDDDDDGDVTPLSILEAMLFVGTPENEPLSNKQVASLMRGVRPNEIDELVDELNSIYDEEDCPFKIISEGSGYRMVLREQYGGLRNKFYGQIKEARLSQTAVDVLAIVAYNQPLSRVEVDKLRATPSGSVLSQLVRRKLLAIQRPDATPRTAQYVTTDRFLELFGLECLDDLPRSQELLTPDVDDS